mgnify:CR=1 FL=1
MKLSDLDADTLAAIKSVRWDRIIEKHEGPENWASVLEWYDPEFMMIDGRPVLLPVERSHHDNITILRTIWSSNGDSLTLFLKDTTYSDDWYMSGFMAVCDRMKGQDFYLAILYDEWFIIEPSAILEA